MPTWDEIRNNVTDMAQKVGRRAEELTDLAAIKMKIASKKADLEDEYQLLGQLAYESLTQTEEEENTATDGDASLTEQIGAVKDKIAKLLADKAELEAKYEEIKNHNK